jgi:hypothetical protein
MQKAPSGRRMSSSPSNRLAPSVATRRLKVGGKLHDHKVGLTCATGAGELITVCRKSTPVDFNSTIPYSLSFRKYGVAIPYKGTLDETPRRTEKRDGTPIEGPVHKKLKVSLGFMAANQAAQDSLPSFRSQQPPPRQQRQSRPHLHLHRPRNWLHVVCASSWTRN